MASRLPYPQDHASHIPFLIGVGAAFTIRSVVEFGSGLYSTPLFLNMRAFPKVKTVISAEPDPSWAKKVYEACDYDERLTLLPKEPEFLSLAFVDLIFVDNGPEQHKIETIRWMALASTINTIVVVHDAEHIPYRAEIDKFQTKFISEKFNPGTAICTNANFGEKFASEFHFIERLVQDKMFRIPVDDVNAWIEVFRG